MQDTEWPKAFGYSARGKAFIHNSMFLVLLPAWVEVLLWLLDSRLKAFPFALSAIGFLLILAWWRLFRDRPLVEAWADHIKVQGYWWMKSRPIYYGQIIRLEKLADLSLTLVYVRKQRRRRARLATRYISGIDDLETMLKNKTGLQVEFQRRWWARPALFLLSAYPIDEPGSWLDHLMFLPLSVVPATQTMLYVFRWFLWHRGIILADWLMAIATLVLVAVIFTRLRRLRLAVSKQKREG